MKKSLILGLLVLLLFVVGCTGQVPESEMDEETDDSVEKSGEIKEFDMVAHQWDFEPSTITVNEGDTVLLHITAEDIDHGFYLSQFGVSEILPEGEEVTIEFVADTIGTYSFSCSVPCGAGHSGMKGQLVVE
ncbi:MAG: cupredoxin domain-containing protein [Nanoarchaeota archaeon]|nr:cupredoxin domain-containing protein [Nanoarchaeota archaeon]